MEKQLHHSVLWGEITHSWPNVPLSSHKSGWFGWVIVSHLYVDVVNQPCTTFGKIDPDDQKGLLLRRIDAPFSFSRDSNRIYLVLLPSILCWRDMILFFVSSLTSSRHLRVKFLIEPYLTHWGRDEMAVISQTTQPNAFSWMKMYKFY